MGVDGMGRDYESFFDVGLGVAGDGFAGEGLGEVLTHLN